MKYSTSILGVIALSLADVTAFPSGMIEALSKRQSNALGEVTKREAVGFNAEKQYVSNTGDHVYKAPGSNDSRGPCPGLNAMANHGYIPRNGVATIGEIIEQTNMVFGMGIDLASVLSVYAAVISGDLTKWSIGGPNNALPGIGLLSQPQGMSGSHNKYETDGSPTRGDFYQYGNDYKIVMSQWEDLFALQPDAETANYDLDILAEFRAKRFQQSIDNNPNFFYGPFSGLAVQAAAYSFIYRFMSNKSAEHPEGTLNQEVLKSFYGITGSPGNFEIHEGQERIPDNWYKRSIGDEYTIPFFLSDQVAVAQKYPQFLAIGGNTGKPNSFTRVDLTSLTGGVYNLQTLAQGNNAACLAFQFVDVVTPDLLKGVFAGVTEAAAKLANTTQVAESILGGCPQLKSVDTRQFSQYPGAKNSY